MPERLEQLAAAVGQAREILILPHTDPDPDAIASALALRYLLAARLGLEGQIVYKGIVGRAENKALVQYKGNLILSIRTRDPRGGAGKLVQAIVGDRGTAGGHGSMASGHVPLRGQDPGQVAAQLGQRALQLLQVRAEVAGRPLL